MEEEYLNFAKEIAKHAGTVMKDYFYNKDTAIIFKNDKTPVTEADKKINNYLINKVKDNYPYHSVDGEEEKNLVDSKYVWVCDPIDGTSMFTYHIPVSVFSLALVYDGEPIVGVVYDPYLDEMYTAIKGKGAYCNNIKISVNNTKLGELGCAIDYCTWYSAKYDTMKVAEKLRKSAHISQIGSVAHGCMLVARGAISAEIFPGINHGHCDLAASKLIVEEAGGKVTNFHNQDQRYDCDTDGAIITNGVIHEQIVDVITRNILDGKKLVKRRTTNN